MYSVDASDAQILIGYSEVYSGKVPDLKEEIFTLNMHKSISIICELIRIREAELKPIPLWGGKFKLPFEVVLKRMCGIEPKCPVEMLSNHLFRKDTHIISLQMLLILLKRIIQYGNYSTLNDSEYEIVEEDYRKIIQLQLAVVEEINQKHSYDASDVSHFLYSTYHLNYKRNVANELLRMYYMMEKLSRCKNIFNDEVKKEYRDYYTAFTEKYGFTPTQYIFLLFGELTTYFTDVNGLTYTSMWKNVETVYGQIKEKALIFQVIHTLSQPVESYLNWTTMTKDQEWDFSKFFEFPFMIDTKGNYISICDMTLINAFFEKIFWLIRDCYPKDDSRAMAFFGRLFEKYIQDVTLDATNFEYEYIPEFTYENDKKSSDAYVRKGKALLVIESKGFSVLLDCMTKGEHISRNNKKLFVNPVLQADKCLSEILTITPELYGVEEAYIISVTMDNINAVPEYYKEIYSDIEKGKLCRKTKYYFNFSIEEYEMTMYLLEQGEDIFALLRKYFNCQRLKPFSSYLYDIYGKIDMTTFMKKQYNEAVANMKKMIFQG